MNMIAPDGQTCRALNGLHPDAGPVRVHFAIPIGAYAAARAIAQIFGTAHGARKAGRVQNTLTAHPAVEDYLLADLFNGEQDMLEYFGGRGIL